MYVTGSASYWGFKLQYDQKVNKELDQFWGERPIEMTTAVKKKKRLDLFLQNNVLPCLTGQSNPCNTSFDARGFDGSNTWMGNTPVAIPSN